MSFQAHVGGVASLVVAVFFSLPAAAQTQIILPTTNLKIESTTIQINTTNPQGVIEPRTAITLPKQPDIQIKTFSAPLPKKSGPLCGGFDEATGRPQPACAGAHAKFESPARGV